MSALPATIVEWFSPVERLPDATGWVWDGTRRLCYVHCENEWLWPAPAGVVKVSPPKAWCHLPQSPLGPELLVDLNIVMKSDAIGIRKPAGSEVQS